MNWTRIAAVVRQILAVAAVTVAGLKGSTTGLPEAVRAALASGGALLLSIEHVVSSMSPKAGAELAAQAGKVAGSASDLANRALGDAHTALTRLDALVMAFPGLAAIPAPAPVPPPPVAPVVETVATPPVTG